jgi:alpha-D-xyloside xylohydrolase
MKKIILGFVTIFFVVNAFSQNYKRTDAGISFKTQSMDMEIRFYSPQIVRVIKSPEGSSFKKQSLSVNKKPETTPLAISEDGQNVKLKSEAVTVIVNPHTGKISFTNVNGNTLLTEKDYGAQFTPKENKNESYDVRQAFLLDKNEIIYGLGQQQNGRLNQRGQQVLLQQANMKVCIPFFQSVKGYGIFWDNYSPTMFTDNVQETSFDSEVGDGVDYYFLFGNSADGVVAQMRDLTGQAPMFPLWVYGFNQSRERYKTQFELVDVVKRYRKLQVPLDGIVQDWQYWGKDSNWNGMNFDPSTYPNPKAMVDSVHAMNAHLFIVAWPGFAPATKQYQEFKAKNMLINFDTWPPDASAKPYDVYNSDARDIYWRYLSKGVFSFGNDAWWLDSTEPDHINVKDADYDQPTKLGTYRSVINAFPMEHTTGVYEHQRKTTSDKRVVLLTRSAFAGQQRNGSNTWSGDVVSNWATLKNQIPASVSFSLTGLPYWNGDIGGFFASAFVKGGGAKNPEFQELYVRWLQFAAFTPMMRSHGTDIRREIYQFGQRGDWAFDVQEKFINLRYRMLPYLYATAWQVTNHAGSIMRSLYSGFNNDKDGYTINNEYLYGQSFLVAPVTDPGIKEQSIYLPAGASWYDFWTGEITSGGKNITRKTPIDILPLYVKAGSIIPWGPKVQYAGEKKWNDLEMRIYAGADAEFTLYEDELDNYNYERGVYSEITFKWNDKDRILTILGRNTSFPNMLATRKFNLLLVSQHNGNGAGGSFKFNKTVVYMGKEMIVKL